MPSEPVRVVYTSNGCEIDLGRRELRVRGSPVPVGGRAFEVVELLLRSAGDLLTKDELMDRIWPGAVQRLLDLVTAYRAVTLTDAVAALRPVYARFLRKGSTQPT